MKERTIRRGGVAVNLLGAALFLFLFFQVRSQTAAVNRQAAQGRQAQQALCVFKHDLEQRVDQSKEFLRLHPNGIPGISASVIQNGIVNQQRTVTSLAVLSCPKETP